MYGYTERQSQMGLTSNHNQFSVRYFKPSAHTRRHLDVRLHEDVIVWMDLEGFGGIWILEGLEGLGKSIPPILPTSCGDVCPTWISPTEALTLKPPPRLMYVIPAYSERTAEAQLEYR